MLEDLNAIDWASLTHAHGEATDVPGLLRSMLSYDREVRMKAFAELLEDIWYQGTVFSASAAAVPFLYELLTDPDVQDKEGIAALLAAIATGEGFLAYEIRTNGEETMRKVFARRGGSLAGAMAQEAEWIDAMHRAVSVGLRHLLPYLSDSEVRSSVADALG